MSKDNKCVSACAKKTSIGGQALIEGIMMRGPKKCVMAVRHYTGEMILEEVDSDIKQPAKFWRLPIIRGVYSLVTSFTTGYKCLTRSSILSGMEEQIEKEEGGLSKRLLIYYFLSKLSERCRDNGVSIETQPYVFDALTYLESHYSEKINFTDLARQLYVGRTTLMLDFKAYTGSTMGEYLTKCRLKNAIAL